MAEPIIEQIAEWLNDALDGKNDPAGTFTLRAIRPKILDWSELRLIHGDVVIELDSVETDSTTLSDSRTELATFRLNGIVTELPADTKADTVLARFAETIRRLLFAGNAAGQAAGGLALNIDCPLVEYEPIEGGIDCIVTSKITYMTNLFDGYASP